MTDHRHLTLQSGEVKGNDPYQLNRMTIDPAFRSSGHDLGNIQGYSATGDIIKKGDSVSLAPPREKSYLETMKAPTRDVIPYNLTPGQHRAKKVPDWQKAFKYQSPLENLTQLTNDRYKSIMSEKRT